MRETRVNRNKEITKKVKREIAIKQIIKGLRRYLYDLTAFMIGSTYIGILTVRLVNKVTLKIYNKLPKILKTSIVYVMVILSMMSLINIKNGFNRQTISTDIASAYKEIVNNDEEVIEEEIIEEVPIITFDMKLGEIESMIYYTGIENGLSHEQAILVMSISRHETGQWSSKAFYEKHNLGGIMGKKGLNTYDSLQDGITAMVQLLKNRYFGRGLNTIEEIGSVYCPIGASNDPKGLNQYWIPNVTNYYNEYMSL